MTLSLQIRYTDAESDGVECTYQQVDYIISKLRNDGWILISYLVAERGRGGRWHSRY